MIIEQAMHDTDGHIKTIQYKNEETISYIDIDNKFDDIKKDLEDYKSKMIKIEKAYRWKHQKRTTK